MGIVNSWDEIARTEEQIAEEQPARDRMMIWASWTIGAHYLRGCFGPIPGEGDIVKSPPRQLKLVENLNWNELAIHAAEFRRKTL